MKSLILCTAILGIAFTPGPPLRQRDASRALSLVASRGHLAGHGKVGGCLPDASSAATRANKQKRPQDRSEGAFCFSRQPHLGRIHALRRAGLRIAVDELRQRTLRNLSSWKPAGPESIHPVPRRRTTAA